MEKTSKSLVGNHNKNESSLTLCPVNTRTHWPEVISHNLTVLSHDPVAM
jgi:hypothetical protein